MIQSITILVFFTGISIFGISQSILIGSQEWSTINLDVSTFRNGDTIIYVKTNEEWEMAGNNGYPAWCFYGNDSINGAKYGKLYNWFAVNDPRGLALEGWHIPTHLEWDILTDCLGGNEEIDGIKLKSTEGWTENGNGNNESGFSGQPGGYRDPDGTFSGIGEYASWWCKSVNDFETITTKDFTLQNYDGRIFKTNSNRAYGFAVRCIKD